ncbi:MULTISPECIES: GNAT family N-acetyltransferase [Olivibacter]|uniref:GNAT family N-acetyltransferase n=1 Tax=Olivibacter jilunii TaxID=985016 RepID=A0ABW6B6T8_9SPHI
MIKAQYEDKLLVIELLMKSFDDNQSVNYIIKQDHERTQRIYALMDYSFAMCYRFGEVWLSNDKQACALILYPHQKKTSLQSVWWDIKLIFQSIGVNRIGKAMKREALIKKKQPSEPMVYLWFIGVNPKYQHTGIGSRLLKEVLVDAQTKGLPIYLETSTEKNLPWYQRFGFRIYDELVLTYVLHFLKYEPAK